MVFLQRFCEDKFELDAQVPDLQILTFKGSI